MILRQPDKQVMRTRTIELPPPLVDLRRCTKLLADNSRCGASLMKICADGQRVCVVGHGIYLDAVPVSVARTFIEGRHGSQHFRALRGRSRAFTNR